MRIRSSLTLGYMIGILWLRRNFLSMIWLFSTPFTILFLFYVIIGEKALPNAIVGAFIMFFIGAGVQVMGDAVWLKLELKYQDILVASRVSVIDYMVGLALAELFFASPGIICLLVPLLFLIRGGILEVLTIILVPSIMWLFVSCISFYFSTLIPNARNGWQISSLLDLFLTILPPTFYPIEVIPTTIRPLAYLIPTTHAALLLKQSVGLATLSLFDMIFSWVSLMVSLALSLILAMNKSEWRQK